MNSPTDSASDACTPVISIEQLQELFPFLIAFGPDLKITHLGRSLKRIWRDIGTGHNFNQVLSVQHPQGEVSFEWIKQQGGEPFLLEHPECGFQLRGQMFWERKTNLVFFLGSPWLTDADELRTLKLAPEDFAIHDATPDLLQMIQSHQTAATSLRDLTEQLQRQGTALRETNEKLRHQEAESRKLAIIAERTDNGVVLTDATGLTVWINDGFTRITDYTLEDIRGKKPGELLQGPETDPRTIAYIRERLRARQGFQTEILNYSKTGRKCWLAMEIQPLRNEAGEVTHFMAIQTDITERKQAEEKLRESEARYRDLFERTSDLIHSVAPDGSLVYVNHAWRESLGYTAEDLERLKILDIIHPDYREHCATLFHRLLAGGNVGRIEVAFVTKSGQAVITEGLVYVAIKEGEPAQIRGIFRDITARKQADEQMRRAKEAAEAANVAKSEFLATISHELRTPLTSIRGFLQTLLADPETPPQTREEFLNIIHDQSLRLSRLVGDLLDLTSLESGRVQFNNEPLDLRQIAQTCLLEIQPLATQKCLRIETDLPKSIPLFIGDAIRVQSIFTNLLSNAVKFTPEGGTVWLELGLVQNTLRITVRDTGPGIPADQRDKIFEKFHRVYRRGASATGTGLGLSIVQAIVDHYRGRIELESQESQGSCFRVHLPMDAKR